MNYENQSLTPEATSTLNDEWASFMGDTAKPEPRVDLPTKVIDGFTVYTNLPDGVLPLEPTPADKAPIHPAHRALSPKDVDNLPVGEFRISTPPNNDPYWDRKITVTEDADGKHIDSLGNGLLAINYGKNEKLLSALGYKVNLGLRGYKQDMDSVPTPQTLKNKAAELGVDIQFFPEQGLIDGASYLGAFADGKYPVSTASLQYYSHDTQDDHLTAMVLGGEPLKVALRDSAKEALNGSMDLDKRADGIDKFTALLRGTVSPTMNRVSAMPYDENALQATGKRIGLTPEQVTEILETARSNAQKFGMDLTPPS